MSRSHRQESRKCTARTCSQEQKAVVYRGRNTGDGQRWAKLTKWQRSAWWRGVAAQWMMQRRGEWKGTGSRAGSDSGWIYTTWCVWPNFLSCLAPFRALGMSDSATSSADTVGYKFEWMAFIFIWRVQPSSAAPILSTFFQQSQNDMCLSWIPPNCVFPL